MTAAGWYPDPEHPGDLRWWDGGSWSEATAPSVTAESAGTSPVAVMQREAPVQRRSVFGIALASLILSAIALLIGWYIPVVGLLSAAAGVTLGVVALVRGGRPSPDAPGSTSEKPLAVLGAAIGGVALLIALAAAVVWTFLNAV